MKCESDLLSWVVILMVMGIILASAKAPVRENMVYDLREVTVTFPLVTQYSSGVNLESGRKVNYQVTVQSRPSGGSDSLSQTDYNFDVVNGVFDRQVALDNNISGNNVQASVSIDDGNCTITFNNLPFEDDYSGATQERYLNVTVDASSAGVDEGNPVSTSGNTDNLTDEQKGLGALQPVTGVTVSVEGMS